MIMEKCGDRNPKFERAQSTILCLVMELNLDKLMWETASGHSYWNQAERTMSVIKEIFQMHVCVVCRTELI